MKRKFLFTCLIISLIVLAFALCASAATTNEFGEIETIEGIDLSSMNTDTTARVVIVDANGIFHTYPAQYIVSSNTKFYYNFTPINTALKTSYNKNSVVRIEVPNNITIIGQLHNIPLIDCIIVSNCSIWILVYQIN